MSELKVGIIGLDTSHSIEFTRRLQAPDCAPEHKVNGMRVVTCLRFPSAFQSEPDQDKRQQILENWGVKVTRNLQEAVAGVEVLMLEINDPELHLEYFKQIVRFSKPIFVDKPPADTVAHAQEIGRLASENNVRIFSASSLRFAPEVLRIANEIPDSRICVSIGCLGKAPKGSSVVWYGVHAVEMVQQVLGVGAKKVVAYQDTLGIVAIIEYTNNRRGVIQLTENDYQYAIMAQDAKTKQYYNVDTSRLYTDLLIRIRDFFNGGKEPVAWKESVEVQAILNAIDESVTAGKETIIKI
ncbi:MAG: Gfo/Idh/MocA family oxidoreductase [bacterium]|nr:Gfo/Idh/MocA family oxidoreductase [bacterium]